MGGSSGGAAAFTMGWFRPDKYRRILTISGSFTNLQTSAAYPNGAWEYHEHLIASSPAKPLRVALSAGERDFDMNYDTEHRRNWVAANEAMATALAAKGYHYRYVYPGGRRARRLRRARADAPGDAALALAGLPHSMSRVPSSDDCLYLTAPKAFRFRSG